MSKIWLLHHVSSQCYLFLTHPFLILLPLHASIPFTSTLLNTHISFPYLLSISPFHISFPDLLSIHPSISPSIHLNHLTDTSLTPHEIEPIGHPVSLSLCSYVKEINGLEINISIRVFVGQMRCSVYFHFLQFRLVTQLLSRVLVRSIIRFMFPLGVYAYVCRQSSGNPNNITQVIAEASFPLILVFPFEQVVLLRVGSFTVPLVYMSVDTSAKMTASFLG